MVENMSNAELLSNLAGNASAGALLQRFGSLSELHRASLDELRQVSGVGAATAIRIKSALALAARMSRESYRESPVLDTPEAVADMLREVNRAYVVENFQVVLLNTRRRLIRTEVVSTGTLDTILVSPREVFALAIAARASALVLVHNLCVAVHKLCYVARRFMCSGRLAALRFTGVPRRKKWYA